MNNPAAIVLGAITFIGGMFIAINMIHQELAEKLWKVVGIGACAGVVGYGSALLFLK